MSANRSQWKKPTEIMRTHRLRKRLSIDCKNEDAIDKNKSGSECSRLNPDVSRKRANPFKISSPSSRRLLDVDKQNSSTRWTAVDNSSSDEENAPPGEDIIDTADLVRDTSDPEPVQDHKLFAILDTAHQQLKGQVPLPVKEDNERSTISKTLQQCDRLNHQASGTAICPLSSQRIVENKDHQTDKVTLATADLLSGENVPEVFQGSALPWDWSLKVKLRIVTSAALSSSMSSSKAAALADFVRNVPVAETNTSCLLALLQRSCNYWVHPSLPWFPEFPRIVADSKIRKQVPMDVGLNTDIQKCLYNSWLEGFTSVYQQMKAGLCPYFYLCCHQFTVLFRGQSVGGQEQQTAYLTPTTRGIREALKREGVDFTMPRQRRTSSGGGSSIHSDNHEVAGSLQKSQSSLHQSSPDNGDGADNSDNDSDDDKDIAGSNEGASLWLQQVGLDAKKFPTLEPSKVKIEREGYQQVDGRAESLVLCTGSDVQALFNFLINFRGCVAQAGSQAGIPPTILAPTPFSGATLKSNKIEHSMAKLSTGAAPQDSHVVDVSGPLLPHHTLNICAVMQQAGAEPSIITFNTHEHSAPLNLSVGLLPGSSVSAKPQAVSTVNMAGSGSWEPGHPGRGECKENAAVTVNRNENSSSGGFANNNSAAARGTDSACPTWNRSVVRGLRRQRCLSEGTSRPCGGEDSMDSTGGGDSGLMGRLPSHVGTKQAEKCCWGLHSWRNGLHNTVQGQLCAVSGLETGAILREVTCFPDKFEWSC